MAPAIPTTQVAVQAAKYGTPTEVIRITTSAPVPTPQDNEVLINVKAVSTNPADLQNIAGKMAGFLKLQFPFTIGCDLAGVVVAVGKDAKRLTVGDEVYAVGPLYGAYAEYAALAEQRVSLKPPSLTFTEAAALPAVSLTALQVLTRKANVQPGQKVLVLGGSSGTGSVAIQLAKVLGASEIAATTSNKNVDFVKSLGATKVIAYDQQQWQDVLAGAEYDIVFNTQASLSSSYHSSFKVLKRSGVFVSIAGDAQTSVTGEAAYVQSFVDLSSQQAREELDQIRGLVEAGKIKPVIEQIYALKDVVKALETSAAGRVRGKLVIDFDTNNTKQQQ